MTGAPLGGARFPCEAFLAGKTYGRFHIDLGFGDDPGEAPDVLTGDNLLEFAGIPSPVVRAIPKPQQFAEKIHAYTFPWGIRVNTRSKDLVDLVLLIETGGVDPSNLAHAIQSTFTKRHSHAIPQTLPPPPDQWNKEFAALASEAQLQTRDVTSCFHVLQSFWKTIVW